MGPTRTAILTATVKLATRAIMLLVGVIAIRVKRDETKVDYKKYLGPDWKVDPDQKAGVQIANHSCWLDIMTLGYL